MREDEHLGREALKRKEKRCSGGAQVGEGHGPCGAEDAAEEAGQVAAEPAQEEGGPGRAAPGQGPQEGPDPAPGPGAGRPGIRACSPGAQTSSLNWGCPPTSCGRGQELGLCGLGSSGKGGSVASGDWQRVEPTLPVTWRELSCVDL